MYGKTAFLVQEMNIPFHSVSSAKSVNIGCATISTTWALNVMELVSKQFPDVHTGVLISNTVQCNCLLILTV